VELRSAETEIISNVQEFVDKFKSPQGESRKIMAEARPRVMAQSVRKSAPAAAAADPGFSMAGIQRVPATSKLSQKQSLFDSGSRSDSAPFGATAVRLLGGSSPLLGAPEATAQVLAQAPARAMVLAQASASYPEVDRVIERNWSMRLFSKGEAQALLDSLGGALARVLAPENKSDACVKNLSSEVVAAAATFKGRLSQALMAMEPGGTFEPTSQELSGVEKVLECAGAITGKSSGSNIGAWIILGVAVAGLAYLLIPKGTVSSGKKK
jgi:hypothetical protein